jgi:hypothetical protein
MLCVRGRQRILMESKEFGAGKLCSVTCPISASCSKVRVTTPTSKYVTLQSSVACPPSRCNFLSFTEIHYECTVITLSHTSRRLQSPTQHLVRLTMPYLPATALFQRLALQNSVLSSANTTANGAVQVVCAWPVSAPYGPGVRWL